jgi:hypothetical protein
MLVLLELYILTFTLMQYRERERLKDDRFE